MAYMNEAEEHRIRGRIRNILENQIQMLKPGRPVRQLVNDNRLNGAASVGGAYVGGSYSGGKIKRKKVTKNSDWIKFIKAHKGQGYTFAQLSKMYKAQ